MRKVAILVSSDKCSKGERVDTSGKAIAELVTAVGYVVAETVVLPDDRKMLAEKLCEFAEAGYPLVLTTGGTGLSPRDVTPEATLDVIDKEVPGISEAMRAFSMTVTKRAMLSRGVSGIRKNTLIINLPGSEKAVRESLSYILPTLEHGLDIMLGEASECGGKK